MSDDRKTFHNEVVSFILETFINLDLRYDNTNNSLNHYNKTHEDSYLLNPVYNQKDNFIKAYGTEHFNNNLQTTFNYSIIPTFKKTGGELIDAWTDIQLNERYDLESVYGDLTAIKKFRDSIIGLQAKAIAEVIINPRVGIATSDGVPIELGTGVSSGQLIIQDHRYISQNHGCVNKWSVQSGIYGLYFLDLINKNICTLSSGIEEISNIAGIKSYLDVLDYDDLSNDNPLNLKGVSSGYIQHEYYFTKILDGNRFTIVYNELTKSFTSFLSNYPAMYINMFNRQFTLDTNTGYKLYESWTGEYGRYYGTPYPAWITLMSAPDFLNEKLFNNVSWRGSTLLTNDVPSATFSHIFAYNDFQETPTDSSLSIQALTLTIGKNLQRKFRTWRAQIPKSSVLTHGSRIGGNFAHIKLITDNINNYRINVDDLTVSYNI